MKRQKLIDTLDKAADKAVTIAIQRCVPIPISKKFVVIGKIFVEKNKFGLFNISDANKKVLFEDIFIFEIAVIIAQRYNNKETNAINAILSFEETFVKHHTDMVNYLSCMKIAKQRKDYDRVAILEDKFHMAEILAKNAKNKITSYRRVIC